MDCHTPSHNGLMVLGAFGIVVYVVGYVQHPDAAHAAASGTLQVLCSFPLISLLALVYIDKRQQHNRPLRVAQFGHLYDR